MHSHIVDKAKNYFLETIKSTGQDKFGLLRHVPEVEKWAGKLLKNHPEADREVIEILFA